MKEDDINSMKADDINSAKLKNLQKKAITVREAVVRNWNKQKMTIQKNIRIRYTVTREITIQKSF